MIKFYLIKPSMISRYAASGFMPFSEELMNKGYHKEFVNNISIPLFYNEGNDTPETLYSYIGNIPVAFYHNKEEGSGLFINSEDIKTKYDLSVEGDIKTINDYYATTDPEVVKIIRVSFNLFAQEGQYFIDRVKVKKMGY